MSLALAVLTACSTDPQTRTTWKPVLAKPAAHHITGSTPAALVLAVTKAVYEHAPLVVIAPPQDPKAQALAIQAAKQLHGPALLAGPGVTEEIERLDTERVVVIGDLTIEGIDQAAIAKVDANNDALQAAVQNLTQKMPRVVAADPAKFFVATQSAKKHPVAIANAIQAGGTLLQIPGGDPRMDPAAAKAIHTHKSWPIVTLGDGFGGGFAYTVAAIRDAPALPGGGYTVFPGRQMIAIYGHPGSKTLGLLGEQGTGEKGINESIDRVKKLAGKYAKYTELPVVPAFEIIATVAAAKAGSDHDYSNEASVTSLKPWIEAAEKAGVYVLLDLQPGRTDFLTQAKRYASLLKHPFVGLALDPEWRLAKNQRHMRQIGSVGIAEVNKVADWLAKLVRDESLPQKVLVLHQFQPSMIRDRAGLDTSHPELAIVLHVDGQGTQADKRATWKKLHRGAPEGVFWGWKNFIDEDKPMLSVKQTATQVRPAPQLVTYQ